MQTDNSGWLLYHSVGVFPDQENLMREALEKFARSWCAPGVSRWDAGLAIRHQVLCDWTHMIGGQAGGAFAAESVTEAFGKFVGALGSRLAGRKVLIAADCFPSLHFLLTGLAGQLGFTLHTVPLSQDLPYVRDEDFMAAWSDDVALAVITWVTSTASKRADLERLVRHGRHMGSLIAVDITQGAGILPFNVEAPAVDFVATTTLKWLCGAPGTGLAYIRPSLLDNELQPRIKGWFSQPDPFNWDISRFTLSAEANRFDSGTPSLLPFVASAPGIRWICSDAARGVREHNRRLCHELIALLQRKGYKLDSPINDDERGGSVMARLPVHIEPKELEARLLNAGISVDTRSRVMRFSPGVQTQPSVIDRLTDLLPE